MGPGEKEDETTCRVFTARTAPRFGGAGRAGCPLLDVGQGDSILIITAQEKTLLIDGGTEDAGRRVVVPYLQDLGVEKIDVLVATHPHVDHIGGLIPVLASFPVGNVIADGQIHTTRTYERFLTAILEQDIPFHTPKRGEYIALPGPTKSCSPSGRGLAQV